MTLLSNIDKDDYSYTVKLLFYTFLNVKIIAVSFIYLFFHLLTSLIFIDGYHFLFPWIVYLIFSIFKHLSVEFL